MKSPPRPTDRHGHGTRLQQALDSVPDQHRESVEAAGIEADEILDAYYMTFQIDSLAVFNISSLAPYANSSGIRILATREVSTGLNATACEITIFVPAKQLVRFQKKVAEYLASANKDEPKLWSQIERWQSVDLTSIKQFWTDRSAFPNNDENIWWEVWLRYEADNNPLDSLRDYCQKYGITLCNQGLVIDDRLVTLAQATPEQWSAAPLIVAYLAEFRRARELATPFLEMDNLEQVDWADELADRLLQFGTDLPAVCVVDSGVNRAHSLLEASLAEKDQHTCDREWGVDDIAVPGHIGHGTGMAGLSLFGQYLPDILKSSDEIQLRHLLESVKILPREGFNEPALFGVLTVEATTGPETNEPDRKRVYLMALTAANSEHSGEPSLWAATVDALAVGRSVYPDADTDRLEHLSDNHAPEEARLWVVAGGNIQENYAENHLQVSDEHAIQNPAEAWNAITVGAMTDLDTIKQPYGQQRPLVDAGQLSPFSRTSVLFDPDRPIKPEIVMEGGNAHIDGSGAILNGHSDLSLLTTSHDLPNEQFTWFNGTSAASALAARMAARIWADYPNLWPETVRGLLVHSARWTEAMHQQFNDERSKGGRLALLRRYGWGVPDEGRALRCMGNKLTLVCEDAIQPFDAQGKYNELCLHSLPWPLNALQDLGDENVTLRVTLSTFIDPHPSRRGRYGYPSHQLRFALISSTENLDTFLKRYNAAEREEDYQSSGGSVDNKWYIGPKNRSRGSVFSDIWSGPAVELATRNQLIVFPVSGWWKDKQLDHEARYSLIISIETEKQETDLWAEIVQAIKALGITVPI